MPRTNNVPIGKSAIAKKKQLLKVPAKQVVKVVLVLVHSICDGPEQTRTFMVRYDKIPDCVKTMLELCINEDVAVEDNPNKLKTVKKVNGINTVYMNFYHCEDCFLTDEFVEQHDLHEDRDDVAFNAARLHGREKAMVLFDVRNEESFTDFSNPVQIYAQVVMTEE